MINRRNYQRAGLFSHFRNCILLGLISVFCSFVMPINGGLLVFYNQQRDRQQPSAGRATRGMHLGPRLPRSGSACRLLRAQRCSAYYPSNAAAVAKTSRLAHTRKVRFFHFPNQLGNVNPSIHTHTHIPSEYRKYLLWSKYTFPVRLHLLLLCVNNNRSLFQKTAPPNT